MSQEKVYDMITSQNQNLKSFSLHIIYAKQTFVHATEKVVPSIYILIIIILFSVA